MWEYQMEALVQKNFRELRMTVVVLVTTTLGWLIWHFDDLKAIIEHLNLEDVALVGFSMVAAK
jgi:hypothetical protein